jgi:hypothetical protein
MLTSCCFIFNTETSTYITITPAGVVVKEEESYTLTCDADGDPAPIYEWFHKDTLIYTGKVLTIIPYLEIKLIFHIDIISI